MCRTVTKHTVYYYMHGIACGTASHVHVGRTVNAVFYWRAHVERRRTVNMQLAC